MTSLDCNFFGQITVKRYFVCVSTVGLWTLYIQELAYMNTFCECISKKFPVQRKEINVVNSLVDNLVPRGRDPLTEGLGKRLCR